MYDQSETNSLTLRTLLDVPNTPAEHNVISKAVHIVSQLVDSWSIQQTLYKLC